MIFSEVPIGRVFRGNMNIIIIILLIWYYSNLHNFPSGILMNHIAIQSINFIGDKITVLFDQNWFQEDISELRQLLLDKIPEHNEKEVTLGADRENVRFQWCHTEFVLNFDYYSQSCWFSTQYEISNHEIKPLFNLLTQS